MDLLSKPERELLEWFGSQTEDVTAMQMASAPSYEKLRQREFLKKEWIRTVHSGFFDSAPPTYAITDKGRAVLEALQQHDQQSAEHEAARKQDRKDHLRFTLIGALAAFGLEHLDEILNALRAALHHLFKVS